MTNKKSNTEQERQRFRTQLFKEKLGKHGVKIVLFDFDDTLIFTHEMFVSQMAKYRDAVLGEASSEEQSLFDTRINDSLKRHYPTVSISPRIWQFTAKDLEEIYGPKALLPENMALLQQIYKTPPRIRDGSIEVLNSLQELQIPMGLVTHASPGWTDFKLDSTGLRKFFPRVATIDDNGFKTGAEWQKSIVGFGYEPGETIVIGDNIKGDIQAASSIGVNHLVWLDTKATWGLYREGDIPDGTKVIKNIQELLDY